MHEDRLTVIAYDVNRERNKRGLDTERLAVKAGVSARFLRNLGKVPTSKKLKFFATLLSVVIFLGLAHHEQDIKAAMQGVTRASKARRLKVDRRQFGRVYSRRGRR